MTIADYQPHSSKELQPALGAASTKIKRAIQKLGTRARPRMGFNIDPSTQFQIVPDLMEHPPLQLMILMHEQKVALRKESETAWGIKYCFFFGSGIAGDGYLSVRQLCSRLADAGLLQQDLRENVSLTYRGHDFAEWLIKGRRKADVFLSELGGWGELPPGYSGVIFKGNSP